MKKYIAIIAMMAFSVSANAGFLAGVIVGSMMSDGDQQSTTKDAPKQKLIVGSSLPGYQVISCLTNDGGINCVPPGPDDEHFNTFAKYYKSLNYVNYVSPYTYTGILGFKCLRSIYYEPNALYVDAKIFMEVSYKKC